MIEAKKYVDTKEKNKKIKFSISFNRNTHNWATGESMKVGYRVHAVPVEVSEKESGVRWESFTAFTGFGDTILECNRRSGKRLDQAIEIMNSKMETYLDYFRKQGIAI